MIKYDFFSYMVLPIYGQAKTGQIGYLRSLYDFKYEPQLKILISNLETAKLFPVEAMGIEHVLPIEEIGQALKQMKIEKLQVSMATALSSSRFFGKN